MTSPAAAFKHRLSALSELSSPTHIDLPKLVVIWESVNTVGRSCW
jgi:hypothetical protein